MHIKFSYAAAERPSLSIIRRRDQSRWFRLPLLELERWRNEMLRLQFTHHQCYTWVVCGEGGIQPLQRKYFFHAMNNTSLNSTHVAIRVMTCTLPHFKYSPKKYSAGKVIYIGFRIALEGERSRRIEQTNPSNSISIFRHVY